MPHTTLKKWLLLSCIVSFGTLVVSCKPGDVLSGPRVAGHAYIEVNGVPFLIPHAYFRGRGRDGVQSELALIASLPGVGIDGKNAVQEWAQGSPRLLMIGVYHPRSQTKMAEGNLFPEQIAENLLNLFERSQKQYKTHARDIDIRKAWAAFVQNNAHKNNEIIDASELIGWNSTETPPEKRLKRSYVAFSKGRIILEGWCDKPQPNKDVSSNCWMHYQQPGDIFATQLIFSLEHLPDTLLIARQLSAKLTQFHEAALSINRTAKNQH